METGGRGGGAVSARGGGGGGGGGARASAGGCRRKAAAGPGALAAADMDLPRDGAADTPAAEPPPSGRINKAAFKLFKRRKAGGPMPSIFGVKNKGDGGRGSAAPAGLARSKTHDGLAEVAVLEGGRKDEPRGGDAGDGPVAKSHSFLSLLRRSARPEAGRPGEPAAAGKAGGRQKRGLRGLFGGVRWPRRDKQRGPAAAAAAAAAAPAPAAGAPRGLAPPGSLSASLECVPEEPGRAPRSPEPPGPADGPRQPAGCGDVIAEPEDEAGPSGQQRAAGPGKPRALPKTPGAAAFQGGGEEMASPEQVDDTCLQEFWDMLSHTEEEEEEEVENRGVPAREAKAAAAAGAAQDSRPGPERPGDARGADAPKDSAASSKRRKLSRSPAELQPGEEPPTPGEKPQPAVPHGDEGHRDTSPPGGPEADPAGGGKGSPSQDGSGGDALDGLDGGPAAPPADHDAAPCAARRKPGSPVAVAGPLRTPGSLPKDSRIPISIKHLSHLPAAPPAAPPPARSELPRTKIPVSKVLVRRVSNRALAGSALRATACHDGAKKL